MNSPCIDGLFRDLRDFGRNLGTLLHFLAHALSRLQLKSSSSPRARHLNTLSHPWVLMAVAPDILGAPVLYTQTWLVPVDCPITAAITQELQLWTRTCRMMLSAGIVSWRSLHQFSGSLDIVVLRGVLKAVRGSCGNFPWDTVNEAQWFSNSTLCHMSLRITYPIGQKTVHHCFQNEVQPYLLLHNAVLVSEVWN